MKPRPVAGFFTGMLSNLIAGIVIPNPSIPVDLARQASVGTMIGRISPSILFAETVHIILNPAACILGLVLEGQLKGILPTPLGLGQSLLLIWPHLTTLIGLVAVCFGIAYTKFMRDEIRV